MNCPSLMLPELVLVEVLVLVLELLGPEVLPETTVLPPGVVVVVELLVVPPGVVLVEVLLVPLAPGPEVLSPAFTVAPPGAVLVVELLVVVVVPPGVVVVVELLVLTADAVVALVTPLVSEVQAPLGLKV